MVQAALLCNALASGDTWLFANKAVQQHSEKKHGVCVSPKCGKLATNDGNYHGIDVSLRKGTY